MEVGKKIYLTNHNSSRHLLNHRCSRKRNTLHTSNHDKETTFKYLTETRSQEPERKLGQIKKNILMLRRLRLTIIQEQEARTTPERKTS